MYGLRGVLELTAYGGKRQKHLEHYGTAQATLGAQGKEVPSWHEQK